MIFLILKSLVVVIVSVFSAIGAVTSATALCLVFGVLTPQEVADKLQWVINYLHYAAGGFAITLLGTAGRAALPHALKAIKDYIADAIKKNVEEALK